MILAGDIGGTNTRLALFEDGGPPLLPRAEAKFPSKDHASLDEIAIAFVESLGARGAIRAAAFGIAGPVKDGRVETTNLPWVIEASRLATALGAPRVRLLNDLESTAWGVAALGENDVVTLARGTATAVGNQAVIAAGTGLGEAGLLFEDGHHRPFACEGGHCTFAPRDEVEIDLLRWHLKTHEHASWEHFVSGPGLVRLYEFLRDTGRADAPTWLAEEVAREGAAAVSRAGLDGKAPIARAALDLFISIYGHEAGNLALKTFAVGGVWVGGGIAPRIMKRLRESAGFAEAFVGKGRMAGLLAQIPVRAITNDKTALLGAARAAAMLAAMTA